MNLFHHKDLGNHLLQLCPKVVKQPVYAALTNPEFCSYILRDGESHCEYRLLVFKLS